MRAGFAVRDQPSSRPTASLVGPAAFVIEQIARYAGVGVGHIVLEAPLRSLEEHLSLMHRFIEEIRPFTEDG